MSRAVLTIRFRNEETLRNLDRAAAALGVSAEDFAEIAIERELAAVAGLDDRFTRALEKLRSYRPADLDRDLREIARSEVEVEDPLRAYLVEPLDV